MSNTLTLDFTLLLILVAYLLGAIPFGLLFARWLTGKDPRQHGSGNIGATNAMRTGGKKVGIFTLLADIAKGALPVAIAMSIQNDPRITNAVALAAFLGHIFPIYLKFKGGKGVATMFGVLIPWLPWVAIASFSVWLILFKLTRYVSLASMIAGLLLPLLAWGLASLQHQTLHASSLILCACLALLMIVRHNENIRRLWQGTESKIGGKP
ncbi:MAG: glycerol-3-phosphate 1-O-acyltransferase PlsY [Mariprofundaceae bacterium]|nr:glycerol-3-phosphate 1-O-acyltransferase PlsY [Mariprofundaceae bacterium]